MNTRHVAVRTVAIAAIAGSALAASAVAAAATPPSGSTAATAQTVLTNTNHTGHDIDIIVVFSDGTSAVKTVHNKGSFAARGNFTGTDRLIVRDNAGDIFVAVLSYTNGTWSTVQIPVSQGFRSKWHAKPAGFDFKSA